MKLPWNSYKQKIEELEEEIETLKEEKHSLEERLDAESERRSKLATKKQEAEKKLKKTRQKLEETETKEEGKDRSGEDRDWEDLEFNEARKILEALASVKSPERDLVELESSSGVSDMQDVKGLKNSLNRGQYEKVRDLERFVAFFGCEGLFETVIKCRPFTETRWSLDNSFSVKILKFIEERKHWALVSANRTRIFEEKNGDYSVVEEIQNRVEKKQKKGGYSQDRFERKREQQIQRHIDETEEALEDLENIKILGDRRLCEDLDGEYLGGFDSSRKAGPSLFYRFRRLVE